MIKLIALNGDIIVTALDCNSKEASKPLGKPAEDLAETIPIASFGIIFIHITSASFILIVILLVMRLNHLISTSWEINTVHV